MGQGLFTKTMQVASKVLGIPIEMVHVSETATDKASNNDTECSKNYKFKSFGI